MENLKQIRFITENYDDLQGLRQIPLGIVVLIAGLLSLATAAGIVDSIVMIAGIPIALGLAYLLHERLKQFYVTRYGTVIQNNITREVAIALMVIGISLIDMIVAPPLSLTMLAVSAYFLWRWQRAGGLGNHYLPLAVIAGLAAVIPSVVDNVAPYYLIVLGSLIIIAGIFDHRMLVNTLSRPDEEAYDDDPI